MLDVLFHSSKTMRPSDTATEGTTPLFTNEAKELATYIQTLSAKSLEQTMNISSPKALETMKLYKTWQATGGTVAIDTFVGDMYSGLSAASFSDQDRDYAQQHLFILSGLYGVLRPLDLIHPYRLEMGYKLPDEPYQNLYKFWDDKIATAIPAQNTLVNASSVEYTKAVLPHVENRVITPKFMTVSPKTGKPTNVVVHAKIARGAFTRWILTNKIQNEADVTKFSELNYCYQPRLSTPEQPVYVCENFGGLGLSVRKN